jgi:hypothetical protein
MCTNAKDTVNACLAGDIRLGFGLFDLEGDGEAKAAALGVAAEQNLSRFLPESFVIEPVLVAGLDLPGVNFLVSFGPSFGLPLYDTEARSNTNGLSYEASLQIGLFGDKRGALFMAGGVRGLVGLSDDLDNSNLLDFGLRLYLKKIRIYPWVRASIPLQSSYEGLDAFVSAGITWRWGRYF